MRLRLSLLGALLAVLGLLTTISLSLPPAASAAGAVQGGGSGFAALEVNQWTADVARKPYNLTINYAANSSGAGRSNYANGVYQYGVSDITYNVEEDGTLYNQAQTRPFKYVTVSAGGLGLMYNLQVNGGQVRSLNLTRNEVCQIFTGELTQWNDPELVGTPGNGFLSSVSQAIKPILRGDSAGESYVLSQYCLAVDPGDWQKFIDYVGSTNDGGAGYSDARLAKHLPISIWPSVLANGQTAISASGADGVANDIQDNNVGQFGITYVAAGYAKVRNFPVASVQNGVPTSFVQPNASTVQDALSYAQPNALGTFDLQFSAPDAGAYFPSTYSYVIAPTTVGADEGTTLAQFLCYDVGLGQQEAASLLYAPLSKQVVAISTAAIAAIPGASSVAGCGTGGPAPSVAIRPVTPGATATGSTGGTAAGAAASTATRGSTAAASGSTAAAAGVASTATTLAATAGSTASGAAAAGEPGQPAAASSSSGEPGAGSATALGPTTAVSHSITNFSAVWWLIIGAVIAALVAGRTRRRAA